MKQTTGLCLALTLALVVPAGTAVAQLSPSDLKVAEANFKTANVSGTGKLTADEFKTFIDLNADAKLGRAAKIKSYNAYGKAFAKVDADNDGTVTWDEYVKAQSGG
jgi:hypothetical protein